MKKTLFVLSVFALTFLMSGCVTSITRDPWALKPQYGWYIPSVIYSAEEATANLKNAQNSILINGRTPTELDIDKFALHATMRWDVVEENKEYVPYYGGV